MQYDAIMRDAKSLFITSFSTFSLIPPPHIELTIKSLTTPRPPAPFGDSHILLGFPAPYYFSHLPAFTSRANGGSELHYLKLQIHKTIT